MTDAIQYKNLAAAVDPGQVRPFDSPDQHLREELWRIWLRVEHEIRRRWELQALPQIQHEGSLGTWQPREIDGLFRQARSEYAGAATGAADHGSRETRDAYLRHGALLEMRIEATLAAGRELPLIDLVRTFSLDARQRMALTLALASELDTGLLVALRYLSNDPTSRHVDGRLLSILVYDSVRARSRLARDLSPRSPLVFYRLLDVEEAGGARQSSILHRRIRPAPRLLPYLEAGDRELDSELEGIARVLRIDQPGLFPDELIDVCASALRDQPVLLVVQGPQGVGKRTLLATAALRWGSRILTLDAGVLARLPNPGPTLHAVIRELKLLDATPAIVDLDQAIAHGPGSEVPGFVAQLCELWPGPVVVTLASERLPPLRLRPIVHVQVPTPRLETRIQLWRRALPGFADEGASELAERFAVNGGVIEMAAQAARVTTGMDQPELDAVDQAVRGQLYGRLARLGKQLDAPYSFADIVA
ncbi:MAG TPA: hypothetical protein VHN14_12010, partial [Kofleriaceae bacterium]|nr:hypothetical protein [Kofleriaceae bacterium]